MIGIVKIALQRPYTFIVMALLILIFGVSSWKKTPTDIFPNIGVPVVSVVWTYTGLPADDMSGRIVYPYERSLTTTVNDIEHIESQSLTGVGILKIFFQPGASIDTALAQVTAISQTVLKQMPAGVTPPQIMSFNASSVPILQLALSSDTLSEIQLNDLALNFIRPQLVSVPGVGIPSPYGGKVRQIQIDMDQKALQSHGLSANDVVAALTAQNLITPVGTQKIGALEYTVDLNDAPKQIASFNDLPIKTADGTVVFMHDVAYVHNGSPPQTNVVRVDGKSAVLLTIIKTGTASTLDIIQGVRDRLPDIQKTLPPGLTLTAVGDQSMFVKDSVSTVIREGIIAAALTGMMILLFLGSWRSTLIITLSIPLAILASVAALSVLGETINVMTLGGLALAVGILVDDATVTIENINWHLEHGKAVEPSILDGAKQIVVPATVSLLCICIAFVPMFGLGGVSGFLFRPMAEAVVFALIASYVLSRTLVPTLANYLLKPHDPTVHHAAPKGALGRFQQGFERRFEAVRSVYRGLLHLCLAHRPRVIAGAFVIIILSFGLAPFLGQNFFPDVDGGAIKMHIRARTGLRIESMTRLSAAVDDAVRTIVPPAELDGIVDNIGLPVSGINLAYGNSGTIGASDADLLISLKPGHRPTADYITALRETLPKRFPGTSFAFLPADIVSQVLNFGVPSPIDVQVVGSDLAANRAYADKLLEKLSHVAGVADPRIEQAFENPTLKIDVNRSLAGLVGLAEKDAATSMLDSLAGSSQISPTFWLDPKSGVSYAISAQTPQRDLDTLGGLKNLPLTSGASSQLLGGLASISRERSDAVVTHYNIRPVIDIYATPYGRDLGAVAADIRRVIDESQASLPVGAHVELRGQVTTMTSAYSQLFVGLAFAVVLIYLLIVVNFQSFLDPTVIVLALPSALAGIVWVLFGTGTTLSVPALTGAIMCMGVATANSILVISFAREKLAEGLSPLEAAMEAGGTRFRPVLMTALAMIIGMLPMAIEPGQNAPLGRAVIGGLLFATCATLFLVPTLFSLAHDWRIRRAAAAAPAAQPVHS
jgi:multidrug efflux pump subunit AcrB